MTREEAIEILQNAIKKPNTKDGYLGQALDMAIKALEQDPCDDCVSRKAVLEMAKSYNTDGWDNYTPLVVDVEDIEELPQVTPIRPKGHWIEEFNDIEGEVRFTCSSCGKYQLFGTDFCYNCGSDNREEEK